MRVRSIRWVGTTTTHYVEMTTFCRDVLGLEIGFVEPTTTEFATIDGDAFQVMRPDNSYAALFTRHAKGPVPLFEVDDLAAARRDLEKQGSRSSGLLVSTTTGSG